ncbi:hypothetical protein EMCRGX_G022212 [Ephydatia muelleri]
MATQGKRAGNTQQQQDDLKLLRLENEFYRTCLLVYQSGVELKAIRTRIAQELLDIEAQHRREMENSFSEKIVELETTRNDDRRQMAEIRNQLEKTNEELSRAMSMSYLVQSSPYASPALTHRRPTTTTAAGDSPSMSPASRRGHVEDGMQPIALSKPIRSAVEPSSVGAPLGDQPDTSTELALDLADKLDNRVEREHSNRGAELWASHGDPPGLVAKGSSRPGGTQMERTRSDEDSTRQQGEDPLTAWTETHDESVSSSYPEGGVAGATASGLQVASADSSVLQPVEGNNVMYTSLTESVAMVVQGDAQEVDVVRRPAGDPTAFVSQATGMPVASGDMAVRAKSRGRPRGRGRGRGRGRRGKSGDEAADGSGTVPLEMVPVYEGDEVVIGGDFGEQCSEEQRQQPSSTPPDYPFDLPEQQQQRDGLDLPVHPPSTMWPKGRGRSRKSTYRVKGRHKQDPEPGYDGVQPRRRQEKKPRYWRELSELYTGHGGKAFPSAHLPGLPKNPPSYSSTPRAVAVGGDSPSSAGDDVVNDDGARQSPSPVPCAQEGGGTDVDEEETGDTIGTRGGRDVEDSGRNAVAKDGSKGRADGRAPRPPDAAADRDMASGPPGPKRQAHFSATTGKEGDLMRKVVALDTEGAPVVVQKKKRGRPRKNPLPEAPKVSATLDEVACVACVGDKAGDTRNQPSSPVLQVEDSSTVAEGDGDTGVCDQDAGLPPGGVPSPKGGEGENADAEECGGGGRVQLHEHAVESLPRLQEGAGDHSTVCEPGGAHRDEPGRAEQTLVVPRIAEQAPASRSEAKDVLEVALLGPNALAKRKTGEESNTAPPVKRKRGRPPKKKPVVETTGTNERSSNSQIFAKGDDDAGSALARRGGSDGASGQVSKRASHNPSVVGGDVIAGSEPTLHSHDEHELSEGVHPDDARPLDALPAQSLIDPLSSHWDVQGAAATSEGALASTSASTTAPVDTLSVWPSSTQHSFAAEGHILTTTAGVHHRSIDDPGVHHRSIDDPSVHHRSIEDPGIPHRYFNDPSTLHRSIDDPGTHHRSISDPSPCSGSTGDPSTLPESTSHSSTLYRSIDDTRSVYGPISDPSMLHRCIGVPSTLRLFPDGVRFSSSTTRPAFGNASVLSALLDDPHLDVLSPSNVLPPFHDEPLVVFIPPVGLPSPFGDRLIPPDPCNRGTLAAVGDGDDGIHDSPSSRFFLPSLHDWVHQPFSNVVALLRARGGPLAYSTVAGIQPLFHEHSHPDAMAVLSGLPPVMSAATSRDSASARAQPLNVDASKYPLVSGGGRTGHNGTGTEPSRNTTLQDLIYPSQTGVSQRPLPLTTSVHTSSCAPGGQQVPQTKRKLCRPRKSHQKVAAVPQGSPAATTSASSTTTEDPVTMGAPEHALPGVPPGTQYGVGEEEEEGLVVNLPAQSLEHLRQLLTQRDPSEMQQTVPTCELDLASSSGGGGMALVSGGKEDTVFQPPLCRSSSSSSSAQLSLPDNYSLVDIPPMPAADPVHGPDAMHPGQIAGPGCDPDSSQSGAAAPVDHFMLVVPVTTATTAHFHGSRMQLQCEEAQVVPTIGTQGWRRRRELLGCVEGSSGASNGNTHCSTVGETTESTGMQGQRKEQEEGGSVPLSSSDGVNHELVQRLAGVDDQLMGGAAVSSGSCISNVRGSTSADNEPGLFPTDTGGPGGAPVRLQPVATLLPPRPAVAEALVAVKRGRGRPRKQPLVVPPLDGAMVADQGANGTVGAKVPRRGQHGPSIAGVENGAERELLLPALSSSSLGHTAEAISGGVPEPEGLQVGWATHQQPSGGAALRKGGNDEGGERHQRRFVQRGGSPEVPLQNESRAGQASLEPAAACHSGSSASGHPRRHNVVKEPPAPAQQSSSSTSDQLPLSASDQLPAANDQHEPVRKKKKSLYVHPSKSLLSVVHEDDELMQRRRSISVNTKGLVPPRLKTKL